jgi:hypothetical protein
MNTKDGALYVPLTTDNKQFIGAMDEAERRVKGFSDASVTAGEKVGKTFQIMTREAVNYSNVSQKGLSREVGLIADIERELGKMREKKREAFSVEEIEKYNKKIQEAELHLKEYNEAGKQSVATDVQKEVSQNSIITSLTKWGIGMLTITGAMKVFNQIMDSSNAATEQFRVFIDGVKGSLQQLYQSLIPTAGQAGNLVGNMIKGFKGAKELSQAIDTYNDSLRSSQVLEAKEIQKLKQLEATWRNASNSNTERKTALDEWITIRKEAAARELDIETKLNQALISEIQNRPNLKAANLSKDQIESFTTIYATNSTLIQKAEEYYKSTLGATAAGYGVGVSEKTRQYYDNLKREIEGLIPVGMEWNDVMTFVKLNASLSGKQIDALGESFKRLYKAQAGGADIDAEVARWMGSIINKVSAADEKINNIVIQLNEQFELLDKAVASGNAAEIKSISEKIVLLQKELDLRTQIAKTSILEAYGGAPTKVVAPKIPNLGAGTPSLPGFQMASIQAQKGADLGKTREELGLLEEQKKLRDEILQSASGLVMQLGQQIGLSQEELQILGSTLNAVNQLATGDYVGMVTSILSGLMAMIPNEAEKFALQVEHINNLISQQQRLIDQADRKGGKGTAIKDQMENLKQQKALADEQVRLAEINLKDKQGFLFGIGIGVNKAKKQLEEAKQAAIEAGNAIEDLQQEYDDFMRGGITENTIADTIIQGFRDGKTGVDDFATYMNEVLTDAVLNIFKAKMLDSPEFKEYMDAISKALEDGIIDVAESENLNRLRDKANRSLQPGYDAATANLDVTGNAQNAQALSGAIKGVSEETASVVAGQMNAMRIAQSEGLGLMRQQLSNLTEIAANTRNNVYIKSIYNLLKTAETGSLKTKGIF